MSDKPTKSQKIWAAAALALGIIVCFVGLYTAGGVGGIVFGLVMGAAGGIFPILGLALFGEPETKKEIRDWLKTPWRIIAKSKDSKTQ